VWRRREDATGDGDDAPVQPNAENVEDSESSDEELEEESNTMRSRYFRCIRRMVPMASGMTSSLSVKKAKNTVYHNFSLSQLHKFAVYDEDFSTFLDNVSGTKFFFPSDRSFFVHDAMLRQVLPDCVYRHLCIP
jgi:hypothetical protein